MLFVHNVHLFFADSPVFDTHQVIHATSHPGYDLDWPEKRPSQAKVEFKSLTEHPLYCAPSDDAFDRPQSQDGGVFIILFETRV